MPSTYVDTSALVKLVRSEDETAALGQFIVGRELVASDLVRTELRRAVRREAPHLARRADELLDALTLLPITSSLLDQAGRLEPALLRSIDAVHLASALLVLDDLDAVVTYDQRMAEAAATLGMRVAAPA